MLLPRSVMILMWGYSIDWLSLALTQLFTSFGGMNISGPLTTRLYLLRWVGEVLSPSFISPSGFEYVSGCGAWISSSEEGSWLHAFISSGVDVGWHFVKNCLRCGFGTTAFSSFIPLSWISVSVPSCRIFCCCHSLVAVDSFEIHIEDETTMQALLRKTLESK